MTVSVSVVGATGYAGGELIRYLAQHPDVEIASLHGRDREGQPLASEHPNLAPLKLTLRGGEPEPGVDVAFLALPSGQSAELAVRLSEHGTTVVDIGSDLRLREASAYQTWYRLDHPAPEALKEAVYGLTERARERLPGTKLIANPGCYPTAALLALAPLAAAGLISRAIVDAKSGISGAGKGASSDFLFTELIGGTKAYGVQGHRHQPEIEQGLADAGAAEAAVTFVPHLVPQSRGILATCYVDLAEDASEEALNGLLNDAYEGEPFVHLVETPPSTKLTWGTNHAFLHVARPRAGQAVVLCVIDNMGKGAAGQAIQNMNVALGLRETAGLAGLAVHP